MDGIPKLPSRRFNISHKQQHQHHDLGYMDVNFSRNRMVGWDPSIEPIIVSILFRKHLPIVQGKLLVQSCKVVNVIVAIPSNHRPFSVAFVA
jgi:hypothetical protein